MMYVILRKTVSGGRVDGFDAFSGENVSLWTGLHINKLSYTTERHLTFLQQFQRLKSFISRHQCVSRRNAGIGNVPDSLFFVNPPLLLAFS